MFYNTLAYSWECIVTTGDSLFLPDDGTFLTTAVDCSLKAIELDPNNGEFYNTLAYVMPQNSIQLPDGTNMTRLQLHLKSIVLAPNIGDFYIAPANGL
jgi:hypothetical protein